MNPTPYRLHILIGQRLCRYDGEYAPEALAVADGYTNDDNPDYLVNELTKQRASGEFEAVVVVVVEVPFEAIMDHLRPKPVTGNVVK